MENHYMDDLVKKALQDMEVPYDSSEWDTMAHRLEQEQQMRRRLMISKVIECSLLIFAIWTVHKILPAEYLPSANHQPSPQLYLDDKVPSETAPAIELDKAAFENMPRAAADQVPTIPTQPTKILATNSSASNPTILIENQNTNYKETTTLKLNTSTPDYVHMDVPTVAYVNHMPIPIPGTEPNIVAAKGDELAQLKRAT
ncbi:MAG: hypothetical protein AAFV80_23020, partial [Bacteroidota bacterium]